MTDNQPVDKTNSPWINGAHFSTSISGALFKPPPTTPEPWQLYFMEQKGYAESIFQTMPADIRAAHKFYHHIKKEMVAFDNPSELKQTAAGIKGVFTPGTILGCLLAGPAGGAIGWFTGHKINEHKFRAADKTIQLWQRETGIHSA